MSLKKNLRTDMALELAPRSAQVFPCAANVKKTEVTVDEELSQRLRRPKGKYVTYECDAPLSARRECYKPLIDGMASTIRSLGADCESFLAVGVGNALLTADALGARTVALLKTNRSYPEKRGEKVLSAFAPGVSGVTGIESFDVVKSLTALVKPDCVIVIDSLSSAAVSRLGTAFQISDSGLTPGSGVGGGKKALSASSLKVKKTISVGVPLVVFAETIIRDALENTPGAYESVDRMMSEEVRNLLVTPKDIDLVMSECAHIIAESVNSALGLS